MPRLDLRPLSAALLALVVLPSPALAQDFQAEAHARMKLSFDLEEVEARLSEPAAAPPPYNAYGQPAPPPLPLEPNSDVQEVTVFRDRALITRSMSRSVAAGTQSVTFEGLPFVLAPDSLYAGVGTGPARIVGVELLSAAGEVEESERSDEVRAEALVRTQELGQIRDRIESLLAQRAYLRGTLLSGPVDGQQRADLKEVRLTLDYVGEAERDIARMLREEEERAGDLDEELRPLLVKLDNPLATGQKVRVELSVDSPTTVEVALRYQVWGAGWTPSYNARLQGERIDFEYQGVVTQSTGEDWTDAALLLSTANPSSSGSLPEIQPWYLGRDGWYAGDVGQSLEAGRGYYDAPDDGTASASTGGGLLDSRMEADVQGSGAVVFAVPGRRTITGDGSAQRIPVGTQTFATTIELAAVPKLVPEVFRRARVAYDGEVPLLPGPVATYVDGDYVGSSTIGAVVPGEEFELAFGTDDRVRVDRQLVARKQEFLGPARKTVRYTFHFRIRVANFSGRDAVVELRDQLPVSELDRVTVKPLDVDSDRDEDSGLLEWQLAVKDGGEQEVEFRFSVTAPVGTPELRQMDLLF